MDLIKKRKQESKSPEEKEEKKKKDKPKSTYVYNKKSYPIWWKQNSFQKMSQNLSCKVSNLCIKSKKSWVFKIEQKIINRKNFKIKKNSNFQSEKKENKKIKHKAKRSKKRT